MFCVGPPGQYAHGSGCGHGWGFVMVAITVTPEIVRVFFLRRIVRSLVFSFGVNALIISAFEGMWLSWCLAAIWVFMRFTSLCVGCGSCIRASMASLAALFGFKVSVPC